MKESCSYINEKLKEHNFLLSESQVRQFYTYYEMLTEKNKVMNLTAITKFKEVVEKHFLDSISLHQVMDVSDSVKILDLGTGAGFPGIPLKIAFPEIELTLMDSLKKRTVFLEDVISALALEDVTVLHGRAEDFARDSLYREQFDLCVSRAVAQLSTLVEYCLPFVKIGGTFVSYKSSEVQDEVKAAEKAITLLGGEERLFQFQLGENKRSFVLIEKKKKTPPLYPRRAGTPSKDPIR